MIKYKVRSVALLNLVNDVRAGRLIPDAYFQRNLVWRDMHKREFIETILSGYPFPQMFISRGKIDVEKMSSVACIVDGQQRTSAIMQFVNNELEVNDLFFRDMSDEEKGEFFKYEVAVVELDLDNDSPEVVEIFKRLNRTANSLTTIEKLASEYSSTPFMYVARFLANDTDPNEKQADLEEEDWRADPNLPDDLTAWALTKAPSSFALTVSRLEIFSEREVARKVHIMYVLNVMSTVLSGFFNRNEKTTELLENYKDSFPERDRVYAAVERAIGVVVQLSITPGSFWTSKANFFTLLVAIARRVDAGKEVHVSSIVAALARLAANTPPEYALAAREAVNNKKERTLRHKCLADELGWT